MLFSFFSKRNKNGEVIRGLERKLGKKQDTSKARQIHGRRQETYSRLNLFFRRFIPRRVKGIGFWFLVGETTRLRGNRCCAVPLVDQFLSGLSRIFYRSLVPISIAFLSSNFPVCVDNCEKITTVQNGVHEYKIRWDLHISAGSESYLELFLEGLGLTSRARKVS
ncbi:hypothetical protein BGX38DRAFT_177470 [Terfezia claveryi]|nr:hypothetical protein BGX38DRAFT_177470 [Terfezia claveryi]